MRFIVDTEKCTECGRCAMACSLIKIGRIQPSEARIEVKRRWPGPPEINVCRFEECPDHPCVEECPFDAIKITDGKVMIIADECTGCTNCAAVCPFKAIKMNSQENIAFKCDLCGGNPACVPECVTGALRWEDEE
jgi:Fe-S-cluster-containing hydrogenase component 2